MATPPLGHFEKVYALAADARRLVVGGVRPGAASRVTVFDHVANKALHALDVPAHVYGLALSHDRVLAACADGRLRHWLLSGSGEVSEGAIEAHTGACHAVAVAPGGDRVATVGADGSARLWSIATGAKLGEWALSPSALRAVAIDPSGEYLGAAGDDGIVRVVTLATGARRDMPGHEGAVHALAFTPRDGRLASAGDDGTIRLWYLVGAVEFESRGGDSSGHKGAVLALVFPPTPTAKTPNEDPGDRLYSAGVDGGVKVWRLDDRRKPRTLDVGGVVRALAFVPPAPNAQNVLGALVAAGDGRVVSRYSIDATGNPADTRSTYGSGFDAISADLKGQKPAREAAVKTLAALDESEALDLLTGALASDGDHSIRLLAAQEIGTHLRRGARAKLRERFDDAHALVRHAALDALRKIDGETSLGPLRAALTSRHADLRTTVLRALTPLRESSPLVPGLIAEKLTDSDAGVRIAALDEITKLHPKGSAEPLRVAYERGPADLKVEVLIRASFGGLVSSTEMAPLVSRALDDADATVRRIAFAVKVLEQRGLMHALEGRDEALGRTVTEVVRRGAMLRRSDPANTKTPTDEELQAARKAIPGVGEPGTEPADADLEPLLTALACRTPDTALRGARALAQLGDTRALGALLQISREADGALRREAAAALQELRDARARKRLVWMLDDADATVRAAALDAYTKFEGTSKLDVAEAALRSSHEDIRVRGLNELVKLGAEGKGDAQAEALLGGAIEDEAAKVRGEAFRTLWAWHEKDPVKALDRALEARFPDLRTRAVTELATHAKERWAVERLERTVSDRDANVARAAFDAVVKIHGDKDPAAYNLAMASIHPSLRTAGAQGAVHASYDKVRDALTKLLQDEDAATRGAGLETLDKLAPKDASAHHAALQGTFLDLRVRAATLLAVRHDDALVEPMRAIITDKDLAQKILPATNAAALRQQAASALATLGSPKLVKYFATELLKDADGQVREQAARGLATASRRGDEGYLLDALGHADVWVRSWAADGLSRLGDERALPVLTGNLRNDHLPIRLGAIMSFAALGPEGYGGMLQGLEDASREVQDTVFAIILARDLRAFRKGEAPELLTSALSSQRPEVRFAAARALELRADPEAYTDYLVEVLMPPRPDNKASSIKDWPAEEARARIVVALAGALASDQPEQRYAAAQVLLLRKKPLEFFREAQNAAKLRSVDAPWVPDTTPRAAEESDAKSVKGWLRRLFSGDSHDAPKDKAREVPTAEQQHLRRLAFGAYVGLLRQVTADEEGHRVRRDAIDRIVELGLSADVGRASAIPSLSRALDDGNHLVRKAALAGLKRLFAEGADEPLTLAMASQSADLARAALDELAARGDAARPRIAAALNSRLPDVRRYAFELLEKLSPRGSLDPLFAALGSEYSDLRVGVIERLASANDDRVGGALERALESDHDDLRLRAAELLAQRGNDRAVDVLSAFLRADDKNQASRAVEALVRLRTTAALRALAARMEESPEAERANIVRAFGRTQRAEAVDFVIPRFDDEAQSVRTAAFEASMDLAGRDRTKRDHALALKFLRQAARAKDPSLRRSAANELDAGDDAEANDLLTAFFRDRETPVRADAVYRYSRRVIEKSAPVEPLEEVLRIGQRELVLAAAEGVAARGRVAALRPLLLVVRAGEPGERERALLALGTLGDSRALEELETVAGGGTPEEPVDLNMQAAATEALGRISHKLTDPDVRKRVVEKVELSASESPQFNVRQAGVRGLRWIGGERARERLEMVLTDPSGWTGVQSVAAQELGNLGDKAAEASLAKALSSYDYNVRTEARKALDKLFPNERTRVELLALESTQADVSTPAAAYLATEGDPLTLVPRLATLTNAAQRQSLRYGLLRRGAAPAQELAALLENDLATTREEAAWLVGAHTEDATDKAPFTRLTDTDRATLQNALVSSLRRTSSRWTAALAKDRPAEERAWSRILWAAVNLRATAIVPTARELVRAGANAPASVRQAAARALEAMGSAADADALVAALTDSDASVRSAAARALETLVPDRAASLAVSVKPFDPVSFGVTARRPGKRATLLASDEGRRLALPTMIASKETGALCTLARDKDANEPARLDAVAALGRAGGQEAVETLTALAFDKSGGDANFRKAAYRALRRARRIDEKARKMEARG